MRTPGTFLVAMLLACAIPATAFAHGGTYQPPGTEGGPGFQVPPDVVGRGDGPVVTRSEWPSWWANNKERYLDLTARLQRRPGPVTGGGTAPEVVRYRKAVAWRETLVSIFVEALGDDNSRIRATAAVALGKTGDPRGSAPLRNLAAKDPQDDVRASAVVALGLLGREGDLGFLNERLCDVHENSRRRAFAAFSIGMIGGDDGAALLLRFVRQRLPLWKEGAKSKERLVVASYLALGLTGGEQAAALLRKVAFDRRENVNVRKVAVLALGRLADRESLVPLGKLLNAGNTRAMLRATTATAIASVATANDHPAVRNLVDASRGEADPVTRDRAIIGLGPIRSDRVYRHLKRLFDDARDHERAVCALALGFQRDPRAGPALRRAFDEEEDPSRVGAYCIALGLVGDLSAAPRLTRRLKDAPQEASKRWAALGLGLMQADGARDLLVEQFRATDKPRLRANFCVALLLLGDRRGHVFLDDMLADGDVATGRMIAAVTLGAARAYDSASKLVDLFRDKKTDVGVRVYALVGLGFMADPWPVSRLAHLGADGYHRSGSRTLDEVLSIL